MGIKVKLAAIFLIISLLPTLFVGVLVYLQSRDVLTKSTNTNLEALASEQKARLVDVANIYQERLNLIPAGSSLIQRSDEYQRTRSAGARQEILSLLTFAKQTTADSQEIAVLDPGGTVLVSTEPASVGKSLATERSFRGAQQGLLRPDISKDADGKLSVRLVGPLKLDGQPVAMLAVTSPATYLTNLSTDYSGLGQTGEYVVVQREPNGDAVVITPLRLDKDAALKVRLSAGDMSRPSQRALAGQEQLFGDATDYRGQKVLAATRYVPQLDWGLVVKIDKAEAYQPINSLRNILLIFGLLFTFLIVVLTLEITRSITRPLLRLTQVTERISGGDLSQRVGVGSDDEIGRLGASVNTMAENLELAHQDLERKVRDRTQALTDAQHAARLGSWRWHREGDRLEWSEEMYRIYGYRKGRSLSRDQALERIHPDDQEAVQQTITLAMKKGRSYSHEYRIVLPDDTVKTVYSKVEITRDRTGQPEVVSGVVLDITDRKQAELRAGQLAAIVESSDEAIISKDLTGRVLSWNRGAETMYGYTARQAIGQFVSLVVPAGHEGEIEHILKEVKEGRSIEQFETERVTKAGEVFRVSITVSPMRDTNGKVIGAAMITRDISRQHEFIRRQRDFVSIASHELRTPLTALMGYLSMALQAKPDQEQLPQFLNRANAAAKRLSALVEDLLSVARIDEDRVVYNTETIEPSSVLEEIIDNFRHAARERQIRLSFTSRLKTGVRVGVDRGKFDQVMINLIDNAIKYTPDGGSVTVSIRTMAKDVTVIVKDTGIGIHPDNMERIYEKFYREYTERSVPAGGTGLGLFITKELVERQGGTLAISSDHGKGTVATVTLPRRKE